MHDFTRAIPGLITIRTASDLDVAVVPNPPIIGLSVAIGTLPGPLVGPQILNKADNPKANQRKSVRESGTMWKNTYYSL